MIKFLLPLLAFFSFANSKETVKKEIDYALYQKVYASVSNATSEYFFQQTTEATKLNLEQLHTESVSCYNEKEKEIHFLASCYSLDYLVSVRENTKLLSENHSPKLFEYFKFSNIGLRLIENLEKNYTPEEIKYIGPLVYAIVVSQYGEKLKIFNQLNELKQHN